MTGLFQSRFCQTSRCRGRVAAVVAGIAIFGAIVLVSRRECEALPPSAQHAVPARDQEEIRPAVAVTRDEKFVRVMLSQGIVRESTEGTAPEGSIIAVSSGGRFSVTSGVPAHVDLPVDPSSGWRRVSFVCPGWNAVDINFPAAAMDREVSVNQPIKLSRSTTALKLVLPKGGVDYDSAQLTWVSPLEEEPAATPPPNPARLELSQDSSPVFENIPTGIYSLSLRSKHASRVKDFVVDSSVRCGSSTAAAMPLTCIVPAALPARLIGFAGLAPDPSKKNPAAGMFCRVDIDVRANAGTLAMAMRPLATAQAIRFADVKPRPDTVWPVSNIVLVDPTRVEFDCPFSHADHHFVLIAADGLITLKGEMLPVEDASLRDEMFGRMRTLIQEQARFAGQNRAAFDPAYAGLQAQQLPNFAELSSPQEFAAHLRRLSRSALTAIELGESALALKAADGGWTVKTANGK